MTRIFPTQNTRASRTATHPAITSMRVPVDSVTTAGASTRRPPSSKSCSAASWTGVFSTRRR